MQEGLPLDSPLSEKLWQVSRILGKSPFDPGLLDHNEQQLDFILLMHVRDNPRGGLRVERPGRASLASPEAMWADVLTGADYHRYMGSQLPPDAVMQRLRGMSRHVLNQPAPGAATIPAKPTG